jgi:crotonobetainyl-CoA:carnitine CoA-transferase CaiB-like acyl-CoA transferase
MKDKLAASNNPVWARTGSAQNRLGKREPSLRDSCSREERSRMAGDMPRHVLDGYRVLDFTQVVAGPTCTLMLAEMGAEVIKVEFAPSGDPSRRGPYIVANRSGYFVQHNRGKKGLCIDLKHPEGREIIEGLVVKADVLVENFAPGVIGRLGFSYPVVSALSPALIMCSISAFGQQGPLANEPGYDYLGAAYAGIVSMCGEPGGAPYVPMVAMGDVSTGAHAMGAICAALLGRSRTGRGQHLDISLLDTYMHYHECGIETHTLSKGKVKPTRSGLHSWYAVPAGIFKARDHYMIIIAPLDHQFAALCRAMAKPEIATDRRFKTNADRLANLKELVALMEGWLQSAGDDAATAAMKEHRVPHAPILSVAEAVQHPHLLERGTVRTVHDRILGEFQVPGFALRFSDYPPRLDLEAPFLGEHNVEILERYLGFTAPRIRELQAKGVLCTGST